MTTPTLFLSLFAIEFGNFPEGHFVHRRLNIEEARERIYQAREACRLVGVTDTDWVIDEEARKLGEDLLGALSRQGMPLSLDDFAVPAAEGRHSGYYRPLTLASVTEESHLLVVTSLLEFAPGEGLPCQIDEDSIRFHLFAVANANS